MALYFQRNGYPNMQQPVVHRIKKAKDSLREQGTQKGNLARKRPRLVEHPDVEKALSIWVLQAQARNIRLTGELLRAKAQRFAELQGIQPEDFLALSNGWLQKFKERYSLREYRFHGEAGSVDPATVAEERERLWRLTDDYDRADIYNMDETGLNYCMCPDRGLATQQLSGLKKDKVRLTFAFTVNADGSDRRAPLIIGHAQKPRCYKGKDGWQLGYNYWWNKKAWMTGTIFETYMRDFDADMRRQSRKVLLLVDNASSHIYDKGQITNVRVEFFSPNLTSHVQPNDGGIIRCFKAHYRRIFCRRAVDRDDLGFADIYQIDQLEAMKLADEAWGCVLASTISNCWRHVKILREHGEDAATEKTIANDPALTSATEGLQAAIAELSVSAIRPSQVMDMEELLMVEGEEQTVCDLDDEEIVEEVAAMGRAERGEEEEAEIVEITTPAISDKKAIAALQQLAHFFASKEDMEFRDAPTSLARLMRGLRKREMAVAKQVSLLDFFGAPEAS